METLDRTTAKGLANYLLKYLEKEKTVGLMCAIKRDLEKIVKIESSNEWKDPNKEKPKISEGGKSKKVLCKNYYCEYYILQYDHIRGCWHNYVFAGSIIKWKEIVDND